MLHSKFLDIFKHVQQSSSCHQKYLQVLENLYSSVPYEDFLTEFMYFLDVMFQCELGHCKDSINKCFSFCAVFCRNLVALREKELGIGLDDISYIETHPFLSRIINETLKYQKVQDEHLRYRSCSFISELFNNFGDDFNLDDVLYNTILDAMLERIEDGKASVRMQAVNALLRLQDPANIDCPVIKAYIKSMGDPSSMIRKEVVGKIAPCGLSIGRIIERLRDVDYNVRAAAFVKCANMGPKMFKIVDRQTIILNGIYEDNKVAKKAFINVLFPKWLGIYNGNVIEMLNAVKLDADESDVKKTALIHEKMLNIFLAAQPMKDIVALLPLNEDKVVSVDKLTVEVMTYWMHLIKYLQINENTEDYYLNIKPELTSLCSYIQSVITIKTSKQLDNWEYLEFQQILYKLFQMTEGADMADEVGRRTLQKLILNTITDTKLESYVIAELISVLRLILSDVDTLSNEICLAISEIREPLVDQSPDPQLLRERNFKEAEIRVKLNILKEEQDIAISKKEFDNAANIQKDVGLLQKELEELQQKFVVVEKVKQNQNDPETISRCLDILIAFMQNMQIPKKIPHSLRSCKDEFIVPLIGTTNMDLIWKIFKCVALYALFDKQIAIENLKFICTPIIVYRLTSTYNQPTLLVCVGAVSDMLRLYGPTLFTTENCHDSTAFSSTISLKKRNGRRLYRNIREEDLQSYDFGNISCEDTIDIMLDMLDDDLQEIRECAMTAISKLVIKGLIVSSSLISRLLLKWFNPLTERHDQKIQQLLGTSILHYAQQVKGSAEVLENAIIPTLCTIGNAPKTNPLAEVDVCNVLQFLAAITRIKREGFADTHKKLSYSICNKIGTKLQEKYVPILTRMLLYLDEPSNDQIAINELIKQVEAILNVITEKNAFKSLNKYCQKLKGYSLSQTNDTINTVDITNCQLSALVLKQDISQETCTTRNRDGDTFYDTVNSASGAMRNTSAASTVTKQANESIKRRKVRRKSSQHYSEVIQDVSNSIIDDSVKAGSFDSDNVSIESSISSPQSSHSSTRSTSRQVKKIISETSSDSEKSSDILTRSKSKILRNK